MADGNVIKLEPYDTLPSTAALAKDYAEAGCPDRYVIFSKNHGTASLTGGKLREGECESGVFLSLILRPSFFPSQAGFLGALTGVAAVEALREHTDHEMGLGWVSDVFCDGIRIGGTSIEGKLDSYGSYEYLIVHFGFRLDEEQFPARLADMVRKVFESENTSIPLIIAKTVLNKFFLFYSQLRTPQKFMEIYRRAFLLRGERVRYLVDGKYKKGKVLGVDGETGQLMVEGHGGGIHRIARRCEVILPGRIKQKRSRDV